MGGPIRFMENISLTGYVHRYETCSNFENHFKNS